jgi:rod shape-determining protein MreD
MRWFWTIAIGVALLAFEIGFVSNFRQLGGGPDFVLLFVIFLALYGPMDDAPISGWILGLAKDSLSDGVFCLYAVLYMALGFFLSRIRADIFLEYNTSHVVNAAASTLLVYVGVSFWHWTESGGFFSMLPVAFTVSLWNAFLAPLAFWFFFKFSRFLDAARRPG